MEHPWWQTIWTADLAMFRWVLVVLVTAAAAVTDWRSRRIPNALTVPAVLAGLLVNAAVLGWWGLADAAAGLVLCMVPFVLLFVFAGGGAGDAKLMAAVGAWLGVAGGAVAALSVMLAGAVLAIGWMVAGRSGGAVWANFLWILVSLRTAVLGRGDARRDYVLPAAESLHPLPYGVAIAAGCAVAAGVVLL